MKFLIFLFASCLAMVRGGASSGASGTTSTAPLSLSAIYPVNYLVFSSPDSSDETVIGLINLDFSYAGITYNLRMSSVDIPVKRGATIFTKQGSQTWDTTNLQALQLNRGSCSNKSLTIVHALGMMDKTQTDNGYFHLLMHVKDVKTNHSDYVEICTSPWMLRWLSFMKSQGAEKAQAAEILYATAAQSPTKLVVFYHSQVAYDHLSCGTTHHTPPPPHAHASAASATTGIIPPANGNNPPLNGPFPSLWIPCYPGSNSSRNEYIMYALDYGAATLLGGIPPSISSIQSSLATLVLFKNYVYQPQLNLNLIIESVIVETLPPPINGTIPYPPWNWNGTNCPTDIGTALDTYTNWRMTQTTLFTSSIQLITGCFQPPGIVGISWIGTLCDMQYGTSIISAFPGFWVLAAHELGHSHGGQHPFGTNYALEGTFGG